MQSKNGASIVLSSGWVAFCEVAEHRREGRVRSRELATWMACAIVYTQSAMVDDVALDDQSTAFHRVEAAPRGPTCFVLSVTRGVDVGKQIVAHPDSPVRLLIGKGPACTMRLSDPVVSRRHLAVEVIGSRLRVTDLGSTNGTRINGIAITDAYVSGGECVQLGDTTIEITTSEGDPTRADAQPVEGFGLTVGQSPQMRRLYPLCQRLAASDVPLIIEGETGTGKEVLAESIHMLSSRSKGPFVVFDCTAVPANLMEAELLGHEKGAFTGATAVRKGVFEQAEGGSLLIDEIGDLDLTLQPKLLRVVERRQVRRLGGSGVTRVDVRVIAATRRDLDREVASGRFRDDLFHRLAVARVELPPLRERVGDVRVLAARFCEDLGMDPRTIPPMLMARWEDAAWPGNLRELRNAVVRWAALGEAELDATDASAPRPANPGPVADAIDEVLNLKLPFADARQRVVADFERRYVKRMLQAHGGNVSRAAVASGIGRRYFHMLLARKGPSEPGESTETEQR
jgi:DNA-binding NtrC family response regulator